MYNRPGQIDELPRECQVIFSEMSDALEYSPGQVICRQGDEDGYLYLLQSGTLSVVSTDENGNSHKLATLEPGSFFGEINFIFGTRRVASVVADEVVEVRRLSNSMSNQLISRMPALYNRLYDLGMNRWSVTRFLNNPLIRGLSRADQDDLLEQAVNSTYVPGTLLFDHGALVDDFFMLLSGTLSLSDGQGHEKEIADGDWFLPSGSLEGGSSRWRAVAVIECTGVFIPLAVMRKVAVHSADLAARLAKGCSA